MADLIEVKETLGKLANRISDLQQSSKASNNSGGPGKVSCKNNSKTQGISMHRFPSDSSVRAKWACIVQRHRPQWQPSSSSVFCSARFKVADFEQRLDFNLQEPEKFTTKRWLKKGAIPSLDCVVSGPQVQAIAARERRQVNICINCSFAAF
ncbi:THAP domain-containing 2-like [Paramuricea clavata]|uniref:THAP domain-containing 2-like n=1 Tax=Paramuricea clavata TaxID=317549 RepID=A0A6S7GEX6_PARCT|nr:THAP domain-containing 2-like [Paramuricea clavata]